MANPNTGKFTWHELMLKDEVAQVKFYSALFGWTVQENDMGPMGIYRMFQKDGQTVCGAMKAPMPGMPSYWLTYVESESVDATAEKVKANGGQVVAGPNEVPNMVRFIVAMDPEGAAFGAVQDVSGRETVLPSSPPVGHFCWDELYVKDQTKEAAFYKSVFGWTGKVGDNDPMKYWHWINQGKDIGGMMTIPSPNMPPNWLAYVNVTDVDATIGRAKELGASVMMGPMDIPGTGKIAIFTDPAGAAFAIYQSARH